MAQYSRGLSLSPCHVPIVAHTLTPVLVPSPRLPRPRPPSPAASFRFRVCLPPYPSLPASGSDRPAWTREVCRLDSPARVHGISTDLHGEQGGSLRRRLLRIMMPFRGVHPHVPPVPCGAADITWSAGPGPHPSKFTRSGSARGVAIGSTTSVWIPAATQWKAQEFSLEWFDGCLEGSACRIFCATSALPRADLVMCPLFDSPKTVSGPRISGLKHLPRRT